MSLWPQADYTNPSSQMYLMSTLPLLSSWRTFTVFCGKWVPASACASVQDNYSMNCHPIGIFNKTGKKAKYVKTN